MVVGSVGIVSGVVEIGEHVDVVHLEELHVVEAQMEQKQGQFCLQAPVHAPPLHGFFPRL